MTKFSRRNILKMSGVTLALPFLESFGQPQSPKGIKRFVAMQMPYGFVPKYLYPNKKGKSVYMSTLEAHKGSVTLLDGFYNPGVNSGHDCNYYYLTCGKKDSAANTVSLDQQLASTYKGETRFKCLISGVGPRAGLSYTRSGIQIPIQHDPTKVFQKMFIGGTGKSTRQKVQELSEGKSVLDSFKYYSSKFKGLSKTDQEKMAQYFTAIREVEQSLHASEMWIKKPYPQVKKYQISPEARKRPMANFRAFTKIFKLALENDSTRIITYDFGQYHSKIDVDGITEGYHGISHHKNQQKQLDKLKIIETEMFKIYSDFIKDLKESNLLNSTICLFGSAMDNPSNHGASRPSVVLAGGDFKHKWHLRNKRQPLGNLYLGFLEKMGHDRPNFGSSTGKFTL